MIGAALTQCSVVNLSYFPQKCATLGWEGPCPFCPFPEPTIDNSCCNAHCGNNKIKYITLCQPLWSWTAVQWDQCGGEAHSQYLGCSPVLVRVPGSPAHKEFSQIVLLSLFCFLTWKACYISILHVHFLRHPCLPLFLTRVAPGVWRMCRATWDSGFWVGQRSLSAALSAFWKKPPPISYAKRICLFRSAKFMRIQLKSRHLWESEQTAGSYFKVNLLS